MGLITVYVSPLSILFYLFITSVYNSLLSLSVASFSDTCQISTSAHPPLAPNSPYLPLHFKLEEIHFLFHSFPQTSPSVSGSSQSGTSSQTNLQSFALNLAQIWVTNLQLLGSFIPNLDSPTLIVVSKQPLPTETLASF